MANNVNNGITGVIDIPGALRSRGAADGNLVGGVVAYAGDIYDTTAGKNQSAINEEFDAKLQQTDLCIDISNYIRIQGGAYEWILISGNYQDGYYIIEEDLNRGSALASLLSDCDLLDTTTLEKVAKIRYANYISNTEKIEFSLDTDLGELDGDSFCIENINAVQNTWSFGIGYFGNNAMYSNLVGFRNYNTGSISALLGYNNLNTKSRSNIVGSNNVNAKQNSVIFGDANTNDGTYSNIIGNRNANSASAGSVLGYQNSVSADSSLAYTSVIGGLNTVNSGGVILGIQNTTDCVGSTYILGRQNTVNVPNTGVDTTVLLGQHLSVTNTGGGLYIGRYNKEYAGPSLDLMNYFAIGGGSSDLSRRNLLEIKRNGEVFISDIGGFDGTNSTVTGIKSLQDVLSDIESNSSSSSSAPTYSEGTGIIISDDTISVDASQLDYNDLDNLPDLADVATSGSYYDLIDTPDLSDYISLSDANSEVWDVLQSVGVESQPNYNNRTLLTKDYLYINGIGGYDCSHGAAYPTSAVIPVQTVISDITTRLTTLESGSSPVLVKNSGDNGYSVQGWGSGAPGNHSLALGKNVVAYSNHSVAYGCGPYSSAIKVMSAYQSGDTTIVLKDPVTTLSVLKYNNDYVLVSGCLLNLSTGYYDVTLSYNATFSLDISANSEVYNLTGAINTASFAIGKENLATGAYSFAQGNCTTTTIAGSFATGCYNHNSLRYNGSYNASTGSYCTLFSIGIGTSKSDKKNAIEVEENGDVFIKGIGGYTGNNTHGTGVKSVQQVIEELTLQIAALTNNL